MQGCGEPSPGRESSRIALSLMQLLRMRSLRHFYENVRFPDFDEEFNNNLNVQPYVPILDDNFTPDEITTQITRMDSDKACGPDGISPGVFKSLPMNWVMFITA